MALDENAKTISILPPKNQWSAVLNLLLAAVEGGDYDGKKMALAELRKMARAADEWVNYVADMGPDWLEDYLSEKAD